MCRAAGKQFSDFARLDTTRAYFNELSSARGIPRTELTLIRQGGKPAEQGTWIARRLPAGDVVLAEFHVQVTVWLEKWRASRLAPAPSPATLGLLKE